MLNECLIKRLVEESRFEPLQRLQGFLFNKSDTIFNATFDRAHIQQLLSDAESVTEADGTAQNTFTLD